MKNIGVFLLIYNAVLLPCISFDWYAKIYPIIDTIDISLYFLAGFIFFFLFGKLSYFQRNALVTCFTYLLFKIINIYLIDLSASTYIFWNYLIIITPFLVELDKKYDKQ